MGWDVLHQKRRGAPTVYNEYGTPIATLRRQYILKDGKRQPCEIEEARTERLILAAPELLAALEAFVEWDNTYHDNNNAGMWDLLDPIYDKAKAAIRKAREG